MPFRDRIDAGRRLAARLEYLRAEAPIVLALPRGGVPVGAEVAAALDAPLDVIIVRKLGVPSQPELGMGAIGEDGVRVVNPEIVRLGHVKDADLAAVEARERVELERRAARFRGGRPMIPVEGRTVVVVDDGIATGGTARAALQVARAHGAHRVVLAVPVAPPDTVRAMAADADEVVSLEMPERMWAIGAWYDDFTQTSDEEVVVLLDRAHARTAAGDPPGLPARDDEVLVAFDGVRLDGHLTVPAGATGVVVFAHGSGSSRHSPRNQLVARFLTEAGLGTLLFDLLTSSEAADRANVFDIPFLAARLQGATGWLRAQPGFDGARIGYFGASTGGGAALWAAADDPTIAAVVSRGGRPDLAAPRLAEVRAPTLLVVGGHDDVVLELNREAAAMLQCPHRLEVVPGATHLFEEPGTLARAAQLAAAFFAEHLGSGEVGR